MDKLISMRLLVFLWLSVGCSSAAAEYEHISKIFTFPESIGDFNRGNISMHSEDGRDISASYNIPGHSLTITVFAFPALVKEDGTLSSLADEFSYAYSGILGAWPETREIQWPEGIPIWSDKGVPGQLGAYILSKEKIAEIKSDNLVSLLQVYDYGKWKLKFRTTFKVKDGAFSVKKVDEFHRNFKWPK